MMMRCLLLIIVAMITTFSTIELGWAVDRPDKPRDRKISWSDTKQQPTEGEVIADLDKILARFNTDFIIGYRNLNAPLNRGDRLALLLDQTSGQSTRRVDIKREIRKHKIYLSTQFYDKETICRAVKNFEKSKKLGRGSLRLIVADDALLSQLPPGCFPRIKFVRIKDIPGLKVKQHHLVQAAMGKTSLAPLEKIYPRLKIPYYVVLYNASDPTYVDELRYDKRVCSIFDPLRRKWKTVGIRRSRSVTLSSMAELTYLRNKKIRLGVITMNRDFAEELVRKLPGGVIVPLYQNHVGADSRANENSDILPNFMDIDWDEDRSAIYQIVNSRLGCEVWNNHGASRLPLLYMLKSVYKDSAWDELDRLQKTWSGVLMPYGPNFYEKCNKNIAKMVNFYFVKGSNKLISVMVEPPGEFISDIHRKFREKYGEPKEKYFLWPGTAVRTKATYWTVGKVDVIIKETQGNLIFYVHLERLKQWMNRIHQMVKKADLEDQARRDKLKKRKDREAQKRRKDFEKIW